MIKRLAAVLSILALAGCAAQAHTQKLNPVTLNDGSLIEPIFIEVSEEDGSSFKILSQYKTAPGSTAQLQSSHSAHDKGLGRDFITGVFTGAAAGAAIGAGIGVAGSSEIHGSSASSSSTACQGQTEAGGGVGGNVSITGC